MIKRRKESHAQTSYSSQYENELLEYRKLITFKEIKICL